MPHHHHLQAGDGKATVKRGLLWQIGDVGGGEAATVEPAGPERRGTGQRAQQARLASAVGADDGGEAAGRETPADMVHRRPPVIGDGDVLERDGGRAHHPTAHATAAQSSAASPAASMRRSAAPAASDRGESLVPCMM
jgi:hypothetical protein